MATHGKYARATVDGTDLANIGKGASLKVPRDVAECSTWSSGDNKEYTPGQADAMISFDLIYKGNEAALQNMLTIIAGAEDTPHGIVYAPTGFDVGEKVMLLDAFHNDWNTSADLSSVCSASMQFQGTGGVVSAVVVS